MDADAECLKSATHCWLFLCIAVVTVTEAIVKCASLIDFLQYKHKFVAVWFADLCSFFKRLVLDLRHS